MHKSFTYAEKQHEQAVRDITRAYEHVSESFAHAAQVEEYWLRMLQHPPKRLSLLERLDRALLGQPGTGSLYDEVDTLISWFRR